MDNEIIFNEVNYAPLLEIINLTHRDVQIGVRAIDKILFIKDKNRYFEIIGQITYTKENFERLIDSFLKIKEGIA